MGADMEVCAGIVTYNPDIELLRENIDSIINQTKQIVIYDNGSANLKLIEQLVLNYDDGTLLKGKENKGIAYALNRLCEWSIENGYDWILTLDQDSISPRNLIETLTRYADKDVAVVSPNIVYKNNESFAIKKEIRYEEVEWTITSASLTNLKVWKELDGFDEWLFIDGVDYDFGVRANAEGYKVIRCFDAELLHELGNLKCKKIFGKTIYVTNHFAWRKYYMARNNVYLNHKLHKGNPGKTISKYIIKTFVFEDNKMEKVASIIRGVSDGLKAIRGGVLVVLSTYNGERYIEDQLDSLLAQKGVEIHILIRDDGSKDSTLEILNHYSERYDNIDYYAGENKGAIESFNDLLMRQETEKYNYFAFCDQDDVWDDDKLWIALSELESVNDVPSVYCSNLMLVDANLNKLKQMRQEIKNYNSYTAMVQNIGTGCTQVFNRRALELYRMGIGSRMEMHDYWMTLVCMFFGKVIYDEIPHIQYRQHENNVVGARDKRIDSALKNMRIQGSNRVPMLQDFNSTYQLESVDKNVVQNVVNYKESLIKRLYLLFSLKYVGFDPRVTTGFKIRSALGRMY